MTIGDVMAVVGLIFGICLSLWVMLIGTALLFESKVRVARRVWETQTTGAFWLGALLVVTLGVLSVVLLNAPGAFKFLGFLLLMLLFATSLLGGAGLALLLSERTSERDERLSPLTSLARGAGIMALAWVFPVLGWFLVAPVSVIIGLGVGVKALAPRGEKKPLPLAPIVLANEVALANEEPGVWRNE
jgi:hypothetical protein